MRSEKGFRNLQQDRFSLLTETSDEKSNAKISVAGKTVEAWLFLLGTHAVGVLRDAESLQQLAVLSKNIVCQEYNTVSAHVSNRSADNEDGVQQIRVGSIDRSDQLDVFGERVFASFKGLSSFRIPSQWRKDIQKIEARSAQKTGFYYPIRLDLRSKGGVLSTATGHIPYRAVDDDYYVYRGSKLVQDTLRKGFLQRCSHGARGFTGIS